MPPDRPSADDPQEWLNRARSNLLQAQAQAEGVYLEDLCFQAQQASEKAIKALLLHRGIRFPHVHDLGRLLGLLEGAGESPVPSARSGQCHATSGRRRQSHAAQSGQAPKERTSSLAGSITWAPRRASSERCRGRPGRGESPPAGRPPSCRWRSWPRSRPGAAWRATLPRAAEARRCRRAASGATAPRAP
ncbi:MAG: HEPN domain-containing protein [Myxococcales bacterium]|nr:HEPN domain-containing protein [Myxococcales bacterium]